MSIIHPDRGLPKLLINEAHIEKYYVNTFATASSCFDEIFRKNETILFSKTESSKWVSSEYDAQTVDDTSEAQLPLEEISTCVTGSKFKCVRDGIAKGGTIKMIQFDPSRSQLLHEITFKDQSDIKTTR